MITDANQAIVWQAKLEAFDRSVLTTSIGDFNIGFPGQYWDEEKQSWYNYFRDYDATTGRYLQSDPIGLAGGINTYSYVYGNPVGYYDPDGKLPVFVVLGLINGSISAAATYFSDDCAKFGDLFKSFTFGFATGVLGGVGSGLNALKFSKAILTKQVPRASSVFATMMAGVNGSLAGAADTASSAMGGNNSGCGCE